MSTTLDFKNGEVGRGNLPGQSNRRALVLIDLQEDFFNPDLWPESTLPAMRSRLAAHVAEAVMACRSVGIPILWVRQEYAPDFSDAPPHARTHPHRYAVKGTQGAEFLRELPFDPSEPTISKNAFSAFFRTSLDEKLRQLGVGRVVLAGVTTAWCIRATATDAYQLGYQVELLKRGLAAFTEKDHAFSLRQLTALFADEIQIPDKQKL